jgi:hypothetical protein
MCLRICSVESINNLQLPGMCWWKLMLVVRLICLLLATKKYFSATIVSSRNNQCPHIIVKKISKWTTTNTPCNVLGEPPPPQFLIMPPNQTWNYDQSCERSSGNICVRLWKSLLKGRNILQTINKHIVDRNWALLDRNWANIE